MGASLFAAVVALALAQTPDVPPPPPPPDAVAAPLPGAPPLPPPGMLAGSPAGTRRVYLVAEDDQTWLVDGRSRLSLCGGTCNVEVPVGAAATFKVQRGGEFSDAFSLPGTSSDVTIRYQRFSNALRVVGIVALAVGAALLGVCLLVVGYAALLMIAGSGLSGFSALGVPAILFGVAGAATLGFGIVGMVVGGRQVLDVREGTPRL